MLSASHDKQVKYFVSYADEMILESEKDSRNKKILLGLAESFLKTLIQFYQNENINCIEGYIYLKLGWIKYYQENYSKAEKDFLYSLINLKNCKLCTQELQDSYWGLINTYIKKNKLDLAKKYFMSYYKNLKVYNNLILEDDVNDMIRRLNLSAEDFLRK